MSTIADHILVDRLSPERLTRYLADCSGDLNAALRLYEWNCAVSAALFEVLGDVEVVVRNALHRELSAWHARSGYHGEWYDNSHGLLRPRAVEDVDKAKTRLQRNKKPVVPGSVVAELTFGFWRFLLTRSYTSTLWPAIGASASPNLARGDAQKLRDRMRRLHDLRNRVAHHEPIYWRHIDRDLNDCLLTIRAVCVDTERWARERARVGDLLAVRPPPHGVGTPIPTRSSDRTA